MRIISVRKPKPQTWGENTVSPRPRGPRRRAPRWLPFAAAGAALLLIIAHWSLTHPWGTRPAATILILGVDDARDGLARSDTVLLARVQVRPRRHMTLVSLPRDTRISVPGHGDHKLNAAYALGGPALTRQTVEQAAGVTVDHTVVVNSTGLAALVDALGGARVTVPQRMDYDDTAQDLHIHLQPGERLLDGRQAVGFVRYRSDGKGDLGRLQRQQTFLKALARQAATLGSLHRIGAIRAAFRRSLQTDLTPRQILALAYTMPGLSGSDISASTLPGTPRYLHGVSYYLADLSTLSDLLSPESDPQSPPASSDTDVTLAVLNGCGRNGYARRAARQLAAAGLHVTEVANAPSSAYPQTLVISPDGPDCRSAAQRVAAALRHGKIVVASDRTPDRSLEIIIGEDFHPSPGF